MEGTERRRVQTGPRSLRPDVAITACAHGHAPVIPALPGRRGARLGRGDPAHHHHALIGLAIGQLRAPGVRPVRPPAVAGLALFTGKHRHNRGAECLTLAIARILQSIGACAGLTGAGDRARFRGTGPGNAPGLLTPGDGAARSAPVLGGYATAWMAGAPPALLAIAGGDTGVHGAAAAGDQRTAIRRGRRCW
jgi:hypothetical protein